MIRKNIDTAADQIVGQQKIDSAIHNEKPDLIVQNIKRIGDEQELIHKNIDIATE
ncbi:MAG: hypothetical protein OXI44_05155 [Bacteroidota bacterium]|nr:hypothetical protein [Bacteroidota bacterium]